MDPISRRQILAATAIGGLLTTTTILNAESGPFQSSPGDGGVARAATELPPGDKVTHHNPEDVVDFPDFRFALDGNRPKVTSGGWAKEANVDQFPISKGIAGVHMFLDPGGSRELHWHANAAEWAYVIDGRCQTVVLVPSGASEINNYGPGDLWFFPKGHGHSIQTIGDKPCHFILSFDNGAFSEHGTFSITDWLNLAASTSSRRARFTFRRGRYFPRRKPSRRPGPGSRRTSSASCTITGRCATSMADHSVLQRWMSGPCRRACRAA
jgi:oxalate decarboxylase